MSEDAESRLREATAAALGLDAASVVVDGPATLPSAYPVSGLAAASVAAAAAATARLVEAIGGIRPAARVRRPLADAWFGSAVRGLGWSPPPPWDPVAGDYAAADGWIRLHTNAPHHRQAALRVLGVAAEREEVARAVSSWSAQELEDAVVAESGCAAVLRSPAEWAAHPQGAAVAAEPLVHLEQTGEAVAASGWEPRPDRPLAGLRVLDLTRVLAGPVSTRLLAGLGAEVLRVDPPGWDEPALEPELTLGKRCARIDARDPAGRDRLRQLLGEADVLVHGYRADALAGLGLPAAVRDALRPGLVDVSLTAYGHSGPWAARRGFDSLVQMSTGIAAAGLLAGTAERPTPLPVQALDQATGWLMGAAVLGGLVHRLRTGRGTRARLSLARTAAELEAARTGAPPVEAAEAAELPTRPLVTPWGPAEIVEPPLAVEGVPLSWDLGPRPLGSDPASW